LRQARKEGLIRSEYLGQQIDEAAAAEVIDSDETARLRDYHEKVFSLLAVDDFDPEELRRTAEAAPKPAKKAAKRKQAPRQKVSKKRKVSREKEAEED
jgi:hypothetical protein